MELQRDVSERVRKRDGREREGKIEDMIGGNDEKETREGQGRGGRQWWKDEDFLSLEQKIGAFPRGVFT